MSIEGILITGGYDAYSSAEVFLPPTSTSCQLPGLVARHGRDRHSQDGLLACGGGCCGPDPDTSCEEFRPATGTWARTNHTVQQERWGHTYPVLQCTVPYCTVLCCTVLYCTVLYCRWAHVSWSPGSEGTLLLGGRWSGATAEVVKQDGTTETSFELKYETW